MLVVNTGGGTSLALLCSLLLAFLLLPSTILAQFRFQDAFDPAPQADPLRKVFGIWGRLLNRMAQQSPPSDDELHLKGVAEGGGGEGEDNLLGEEGMPRGMGGGDRTRPIAADRIISEGKLNEILPRLNPIGQTSTTTSSTTTTTTTTTSTTTTNSTTAPTTSTTTSAAIKRKGKKKKKGRGMHGSSESSSTPPSVPQGTSNASEPDPTTTSSTPSPTSTTSLASVTTEQAETSRIPPMSILKDDEDQKEEMARVVGATIRLRTSAEKGANEVELPVKQSQEIGANLNESVLARMENETAQLIAEIENVLAEAEVGPNGGHWLREGGGAGNSTASSTAESSTSEREEEEEEEEDEEEGDSDEEKDEEEERKEQQKEGEREDGNGTTVLASMLNSTTVDPTTSEEMRPSLGKFKVILPEAEEEEQAAEIAQLQLDSTAAVSTASPASVSSTTTANGTAQSAQNIFNLNSNANSNANPNFSTMIRPINSVIDGIGPLILPLIGYSRQALDAYSPFRADGVSIFRPGGLAGPSQSPGALMPFAPSQQQQQPLMPPGHAARQFGVPIGQRPQPLAHPRQLPTQPIQPQQAVPDPPSLELLGRIIEQRRQREREKQRLQEVSGSSPPAAEQSYFPPNLDRITQTESIPPRPVPSSSTAAVPSEDRGYDAGRKGVLDTFHEDSGLMFGQQQAQAQNGTPQNAKAPASQGNTGGGGFGGGRRAPEAPFQSAAQ